MAGFNAEWALNAKKDAAQQAQLVVALNKDTAAMISAFGQLRVLQKAFLPAFEHCLTYYRTNLQLADAIPVLFACRHEDSAEMAETSVSNHLLLELAKAFPDAMIEYVRAHPEVEIESQVDQFLRVAQINRSANATQQSLKQHYAAGNKPGILTHIDNEKPIPRNPDGFGGSGIPLNALATPAGGAPVRPANATSALPLPAVSMAHDFTLSPQTKILGDPRATSVPPVMPVSAAAVPMAPDTAAAFPISESLHEPIISELMPSRKGPEAVSAAEKPSVASAVASDSAVSAEPPIPVFDLLVKQGHHKDALSPFEAYVGTDILPARYAVLATQNTDNLRVALDAIRGVVDQVVQEGNTTGQKAQAALVTVGAMGVGKKRDVNAYLKEHKAFGAQLAVLATAAKKAAELVAANRQKTPGDKPFLDINRLEDAPELLDIRFRQLATENTRPKAEASIKDVVTRHPTLASAVKARLGTDEGRFASESLRSFIDNAIAPSLPPESTIVGPPAVQGRAAPQAPAPLMPAAGGGSAVQQLQGRHHLQPSQTPIR